MSAVMTEHALSRRLITIAEALEQVGANDLSDLHRRADLERRGRRHAA